MYASKYTTCVLLHDGGVLCFGDDSHGQLGQGSSTAQGDLPASLTAVTLKGKAAELAVGEGFVCALMEDHRTIFCWGDNRLGQLGVGSVASSVGPNPETRNPKPEARITKRRPLKREG